jgi:putative Mg2+ transporter-C (MgtC) family protein
MLLSVSAPTISDLDVVVRLAVAAGLGAVVGIERELREREAGLRTHMLVALGSGLFTIVSAYGFESFYDDGITVDPTRIAAQIVAGVGFLGAGAIIREGLSVRGLTTAGSLWIVAAIGMAAGAGYYVPAVVGAALTVFALGPMRRLAYLAIGPLREEEHRIVVELRPGTAVSALLETFGGTSSLEVDDERDRRIVTADLERKVDEGFVARVSDLDDVIAVRWRR